MNEKLLNKVLDVRDCDGRRINMNIVLPSFVIGAPTAVITVYVTAVAVFELLCSVFN